MKVVEWSKSFKMKTWTTLNSVQVRDTVEFYPIPALDGAFGRTRPICRNPILLFLNMFKLSFEAFSRSHYSLSNLSPKSKFKGPNLKFKASNHQGTFPSLLCNLFSLQI